MFWPKNHFTLRADVSPSLAWLLALTKSLASLLSRVVGLFYTSRRQRKSHTRENPCARRVKWFNSLTTLNTWLTPFLPVNKYNNIMLGITNVTQGIRPFSPLCFFQWTRHCFDIKALYWHFNYEKCSVNVL